MQNKRQKMISMQTSSFISLVLLIPFLLFLRIYFWNMFGTYLDIDPHIGSSLVFFLLLLVFSLFISSFVNSSTRLLYLIPVFTTIIVVIEVCLFGFGKTGNVFFNPLIVMYSIVLYFPVVLFQLFLETRDRQMVLANQTDRPLGLCIRWMNFRLLVVLSFFLMYQNSYIVYMIRESPSSNAMEAAIGSVILFAFSGTAVLAIFIGMLIALRKTKKSLQTALLLVFLPIIFVLFSGIYFFVLISLSGYLSGV